ncbi:hypothetical protein [Alicyclobacillus acidoterrestris]|uniref:Uncharacterized protein n=1 Tax=Alicyclobacillus acidoterrestris (strain ATCC 49025 / DSM 3922 / CIP 106132 / NCIMB 13137 / GD3B) TaxID=1356854 RepID=T0C8R8_ALIAG|nr:hypothetical protein [Alicyclobacillus acidoterrestris]EPZ48890.1 hypothetical protein N007_03380 [Alicyclobacillus acidoterrestris ATCC 49025]UNO47428.1 hypothetical protein K1I37_11960 [Alicyclobacillus acidoterrestris]
MAWVYYLRLVPTKFEATCLAARVEEGTLWATKRLPRYVGVFQTNKGRFGVKAFWD